MLKIKCIIIILCVCFAVNGHATEVQPKGNTIKIVDDSGYELTLDKPATRILALYSPLSQMMLELNLGHTLIGRTYADDEIEGLKHLPAIGTSERIVPERIFKLKPQLVIQFMGNEATKALGLGLRKLGVPVLLFRLQNFDDIFSAMEKLGEATGTQAHANSLVKEATNRIGHLRNILMDLPRVSVFYELRYPHLLTIGADSLMEAILHVAGARNIISGSEYVLRIDDAELFRKNPEAYIVQKGTLNAEPMPLDARPGFEVLQAVKNKRILIVEENEFARAGIAAVKAAEKLAHWLHPDVNFDIQTPEKTEPVRK